MSDHERAGELLDLIDVDALGLERVLASVLHACRDADRQQKRDLLMRAIALSNEGDDPDWEKWVDCLLRDGPRSELLAETGLFMPEELPEPEELRELALDQARRLKAAAEDFLLGENHPATAKTAAYGLDLIACDLEIWAGLPPRPPVVMPFKTPDWLDEYSWDEDGVLQGWAIDPETGNERRTGAAGNPVDALVDEMNETFCAVLDGGGFSVFMRDQDPAFGRPFWARLSREAFRHYFEDERVPIIGTSKQSSATKAQLWLEHPRRRKYRGIVMDPRGLPENRDKLNLWQGWSVAPAPGDWSIMRELIEDVLCDGNRGASDYVLRWIAFMLQRPWETPETAIAFRGKEGTGKGTLGRALMRIAGPHGLTVSSPGQLSGRFNSHLRDCVFLFADEAMWPGDKSSEGTLKQLVTEPVISYEAKGKDLVQGKNMVHLMLASNEEWVVPAGRGARRFFVADVSDRRRQDREFFGALWRQMDGGGLAGMIHDLLAMDLAGWHPSRGMPQTQALADQKVLSLGPIEKFWLEVLSQGDLPLYVAELGGSREFDWENGPVTLGPKDRALLVEELNRFLLRRRIMHARATHKALLKVGAELGVETSRPGGKERIWTLPPLPEMRQAFEKMVGSEGLFD